MSAPQPMGDGIEASATAPRSASGSIPTGAPKEGPGRSAVWAVVPLWNARRRLPALHDALDDQVAGVVVVDNASTDDGVAWLRANWPTARLLCQRQNVGYAAAVNRGLEAVRAADPVADVLLLNDDACPRPGAIAALGAALRRQPTAGAATAKLVYHDRPDVLNGTGGRYLAHRALAELRGEGERDRGQYDRRRRVDYPSGAASLLRRAALDAVGPLDEAYFLYYEDVDWGLRARAAGWTTVFVPQAVVTHIGSAGTARDIARRRYYNVRNRLRFARRHAPLTGRLWAWLATLALLAKQPARWPSRRRRREAEAVALAVADHLRRRYGRGERVG